MPPPWCRMPFSFRFFFFFACRAAVTAAAMCMVSRHAAVGVKSQAGGKLLPPCFWLLPVAACFAVKPPPDSCLWRCQRALLLSPQWEEEKIYRLFAGFTVVYFHAGEEMRETETPRRDRETFFRLFCRACFAFFAFFVVTRDIFDFSPLELRRLSAERCLHRGACQSANRVILDDMDFRFFFICCRLLLSFRLYYRAAENEHAMLFQYAAVARVEPPLTRISSWKIFLLPFPE